MGSSTDWNQEEIIKDKNMSVTRVGKTHCCYCSVSQSCPTLFNLTNCRTPGLPVPHHFLKFAQVHVCCIGDAIQPSHSLIPFSPSVLCLSQHQGLFQWVSYSHQMTKILERQLQHQFFQWVFRINFPQDWLVWSLAVQCTLRHLLQHYSVKASIIWHSAFLMVQLSQSYMTTGKTIALTIQTFVSRVMSLLFNTLSRFVMAFLPRSNHLLISWLQSPFTVILESKKKKSVTTFMFSPICHEITGLNTMIFSSVQFSSVAQLYLTLCDHMDCSMPGIPVHHQLPEFTQTHVHWVIDANEPSHPLSSPSPPTFNLSHQGLFKWVSSSYQVAKVLKFQIQSQSFQWIFRTDLL